MAQRYLWKAKAKTLASTTPDVTEEQVTAWGEFKRLRNKINNLKGLEEDAYKREKIEEIKDDSAKVWKTTKSFMKWKTPGAPTQLEENGLLKRALCVTTVNRNDSFINEMSWRLTDRLKNGSGPLSMGVELLVTA